MIPAGPVTIGLAVIVSVAPASFAQDSRVPDHDNSSATGNEAEEREMDQVPGGNARVSVAAPIGKVWVDPEFVDGEPVYVSRTTASAGMAIVEVSTTPFMPVLPSNGDSAGVRQSLGQPDQPASW